MLCAALSGAGEDGTETRKAIYSRWLHGSFNGASFALPGIGHGCGVLDWKPDRDGFSLTWHSPAGVACRLARLYPQADGTWAAMVVAGVKDELPEAMAAAEWAVSRLSG
ncbi:hypothetical protein Q8W71_28865 [Methylobacterium sp. NEAU 140]|uniref:hypothetical protein n=1 Tax=Methylobacterium sp. NEAU 140 TaxID=3064945 RepID=UPI002734E5ED|nr:hypothetical protein [Methylobacterium sp. NEAU 140]MDP4026625.1 hypothetical protein [Methylobacterium sp. NEAU 140]